MKNVMRLIFAEITKSDIEILDSLQKQNKLKLEYVNTDVLTSRESRVVWFFFCELQNQSGVNVYSGDRCPDYSECKRSVFFKNVRIPEYSISIWDRLFFRKIKIVATCCF